MAAPRYTYIDNLQNEFDRNSKKIDRYYRRDFSPIKTTLRKLFPSSAEEIISTGQLRTVPFIHAVCRELSTLYALPPRREFLGLISRDLSARMAGLYSSMEINKKFRIAQELLICQGNAVLICMPDASGFLQVMVLPPWRVKAERDDILSTDARSVQTWRITLPRRQNAVVGFQQDELVITPTEAYWQNEGTGAWAEDGSNPLGVAPVVVLRANEPEPGMMFSPIPDDLLQCQENLIVALTDVFRSCMYSAHGQKIIKGMSSGEARTLTLGPDVVLGLEDDQDYSCVNNQAASGISSYLEATDNYLRQVLGANRVNVANLFKSSAVTAQAKVMESADRSIERRLLAQELVDNGEQRMYRMIARWINAMQGSTVFPVTGIQVDIEWRKEEPEIDKLHAAQALALRQKMGLESPAQVVSRERGVSLADAKRIVRENLEDYRELLDAVGDVDAKIDKGIGGASGVGVA